MARPKVENHKTAEGILEGAKKCFLTKGFAGTSINDIADEAKINKSLIYHHFGNKENLWKAVKGYILERAQNQRGQDISFNQPILEEFLDAFVTFRFQLYADHPELIRLIGWQRLEFKKESLSGVNLEPFLNLEDHIRTLQKKGEIRKDIPADMIYELIMSMSASGFIDNAPFLKTKSGREQYRELIIDGLMKMLSPKG